MVIGTLLLGFMVAAWGVFDHVAGSGTTSTALVVGGALVLVPADGAARGWARSVVCPPR